MTLAPSLYIRVAIMVLLVSACGTTDEGTIESGTEVDPSTSFLSCGSDFRGGPFDRSCLSDSDCLAGTVQIDCCGSQRAIGYAQADAVNFATAADQCAKSYPSCNCGPKWPRAEDDAVFTLTGPSGPTDDVSVACVSGWCRTFVAR